MSRFKSVLITGSTSGLGRAMLESYAASGTKVICVDQRRDEDAVKQFPGSEFHVLDITSYDAVLNFMRSLGSSGKLPDAYILNAGINKIDNVSGFDYKMYQKVMDVNLTGVMTFVGAISELKIQNSTILGMSSTSNIIPNPGHIGYFASKLIIKKAFECLAKNDPSNDYKSVVLGPVHTRIMRDYPNPSGLQGKIFSFLAVTADHAVRAFRGFLERKGSGSMNFPLGACAFYYFVRTVLVFLPGIYGGSKALPETAKLANSSNR